MCYIFIKYKILLTYYIIILGYKLFIICQKSFKFIFESYIRLIYWRNHYKKQKIICFNFLIKKWI